VIVFLVNFFVFQRTNYYNCDYFWLNFLFFQGTNYIIISATGVVILVFFTDYWCFNNYILKAGSL
jgi:hypothetical protein